MRKSNLKKDEKHLKNPHLWLYSHQEIYQLAIKLMWYHFLMEDKWLKSFLGLPVFGRVTYTVVWMLWKWPQAPITTPKPCLLPKTSGLADYMGCVPIFFKILQKVSSGALLKCQCQVLARGENFIAIINLENMFFIKQVPAQPSVQLW